MKKNITSAMFLFSATFFCVSIKAQTENYFAGYNSGGKKTGSYLTGVGYNVMRIKNAGWDNTAFGSYAMEYINTGGHNTAIGSYAINKNSTGSDNTCVGAFVMRDAVGSSYNTALGNSALSNMISGDKNTAIGYGALTFSIYSGNCSASLNTAVGCEALNQNITGFSNASAGVQFLYSNTTGYYNVAAGNSALYANTTGYYNVATSPYALGKNTTGRYNIAMGFNAGYALISGSNNNTFIGTQADATVQLSNSTAIDNGTKVNASNKVRISNSSVTVIGGAVNWSITKVPAPFITNKKVNLPGLLFINKLKPITFNVDEVRFAKFLGMADSVSDTEKKLYSIASNKICSGLMPEEVEKTAEEIGYNFDGIKPPQNEKDNYSIAYADFVPSLVKTVQELSAENEKLKSKTDVQEKINTELQKQIDVLKALILQNSTAPSNALQLAAMPGDKDGVAALFQNAPNPFNQNTVIKYSIPQQTKSAVIKITAANGVQVKSITLTQKGNGQISIDGGALAAG